LAGRLDPYGSVNARAGQADWIDACSGVNHAFAGHRDLCSFAAAAAQSPSSLCYIQTMISSKLYFSYFWFFSSPFGGREITA